MSCARRARGGSKPSDDVKKKNVHMHKGGPAAAARIPDARTQQRSEPLLVRAGQAPVSTSGDDVGGNKN